MKALCSLLTLALLYEYSEETLSKTDAKKSTTKAPEAKIHLSDHLVQDRGLVVTDPKAKDIILEHKSYCAKRAKERHFQGDVLGYVTPWNGNGYDIAETFGGKFTMISPVWLQVKRMGKELFQVTGLHDADQGWIKDVKKNSRNTKIVPRILFDGWSYQDFENVFGSEDEIEELGSSMVQVAKNEKFDGFVIEVWSQLGGQRRQELVHMLGHLAEALHEAKLKFVLVIPPSLSPGRLQCFECIGPPKSVRQDIRQLVFRCLCDSEGTQLPGRKLQMFPHENWFEANASNEAKAGEPPAFTSFEAFTSFGTMMGILPLV